MPLLNFTKNQFLKHSFRINTRDLKQPVGPSLLRFPATSLTSSTSNSPLIIPSWPLAHLLSFKNPGHGPAQRLSSLFSLLKCSSNLCTTGFLTLLSCPPVSPFHETFFDHLVYTPLPSTHCTPFPLILVYFSF